MTPAFSDSKVLSHAHREIRNNYVSLPRFLSAVKSLRRTTVRLQHRIAAKCIFLRKVKLLYMNENAQSNHYINIISTAPIFHNFSKHTNMDLHLGAGICSRSNQYLTICIPEASNQADARTGLGMFFKPRWPNSQDGDG
ncbi:predicted protein [Sclerotinia sclerotiorum 1980 UF-70]|uniref:Uncharacterized protein n=1 Tax=Sclerotinia sclerotiorum (strain ATCC 18683 / 1980 / Ss-1) TaxID=665079 RepID=A7EQN1_SCLS1|nr:predicted protein [Sclerotinia sclerotiorum 1980 UF-70]EDN91773.1 predicted protein [Sclerotinia sclerotiorum 1980 UF-70]